MAWRIWQSVTSGSRTGSLESRVSSAAPAADDPHIVALVGRAVARDQAAFAELYELYVGYVYRYTYYRTANRADAEDLTEQVFLQAWAAIDRFRSQGKPFLAWLYAVAHNAVVDWRRRAAPSDSLDHGELQMHIASQTAAQAMTQWMDAQLLARAISCLTHEQQQVITLKFIDELD